MIILLFFGSFLNAQKIEEQPAFYKEMKSSHPNVYVVDSLYEIYRSNTSNEFDAESLKRIKEEKAKNKSLRSSWLSHARKEASPIKKEFRSEYEKEYIEWRKEIQEYIDENGNVDYPTEKEFQENFKVEPKKSRLFSRSSSGARSSNVLTTSSIYDSSTTPYQSTFEGWHYYGPVQLLTNNGKPNVTSQANVRAFAQSRTNPNHLVCAVEGGTVYISHDKGVMWHLATRNYNIKNITALSFSASDENVIYAGSGTLGGRLYVSRDGGVTWNDVTKSSGYSSLPVLGGPGNQFSKIISISTDGNPLNDLTLMATKRGLLKLKQTLIDGEISYRFEVKLDKGMTDVIKRPNHDDEYYALAYDKKLNHMYFYKSIDKAETFSRKGANGDGWFEPSARIFQNYGGRLAASLSNDKVVYAYLIEGRDADDNKFLGVYRSDNAGENWILPNPNGPGRGKKGYNSKDNKNLATFPFQPTGKYTQGFYNCAMLVSPTDPMHIIVGGLNAFSSENGGVSFNYFGGYWGKKQLHPDMQTFFQQKNSDGTVDTWLTTDGGINYSTDFFAKENIVRTAGLGGDYWGFDVGEYNTTMGGGMYHNGDSYHVESYGKGVFKHLGGGEHSTGYVLPGYDERQMYFSDVGGIIASPKLTGGYKGTSSINPKPIEPYAGGDNQYYTQRDHFGNTYYYRQSNDDKAEGKVKLYYFSIKENKSKLLKEIQISKGLGVQQYIVSFSNPLYQYLLAGNKIFASTDGGESWSEKTKPFNNNMIIAVSDVNPKTIYVLKRYAKWKRVVKVSRDGGKTYTPLDNPDTNFNYRHILNVRGTDVIFIFGNKNSKVFYYIDGKWKEYSEDLPFNLNIIEAKIQYRSGEFFMATSGCGIWTRKLPDDVLKKMNVLKLNITSPKRVSYKKDFVFKLSNTSLYYGKNITSIKWEFPGSSKVTGADTNSPTVEYDKYGRFGVKLTLVDDKGNEYSNEFKNYFTVYPFCSCSIPSVMKDLLSNIVVWTEAKNADLNKGTITDNFTGKVYGIKGVMELKQQQDKYNGNKVLNSTVEGKGYIELDKVYEGKTFFVVSRLNKDTDSQINFLLGGNKPDFHGGGRKGPIFSSRWMTDTQRFNQNNNGRTMINNHEKDYFSTNYVTDNLAVYGMRVADGKKSARVRYISKDRDRDNRIWQGEIAEIIILNEAISDSDMEKINLYLMDKYGIAHSETP